MTDRDRLAADLTDADAFGWLVARSAEFDDDYFRRRADRLIALGWGKNMTADDAAYATGREDGLAEALDEDRLARALCASRDPVVSPSVPEMFVDDECRAWAGRIAAEYARLTEAEG